MPTLAAPTVAPSALASSTALPTQRYYIMGAASLPEGSAFTVTSSHWYLLTEFALGFLTVEEVVAALTADASVPLTGVASY